MLFRSTYSTSNSALPDNSIKSISFDKIGNTWIGTQNGGLAVYDGITWIVYNVSNSNIPDNYVRSIAFDTLGNAWIGTIGGLAKFDGTTWTIYNMFNSSLISNNIAALHVDTITNTIYAGTINGGLTVINDTVLSTFTIQNSGLPDNSIVAIDEYNGGIIWLGMPAFGITAFIINSSFFNLINIGIRYRISTED